LICGPPRKLARLAPKFDFSDDTLAPVSGHDGADWVFGHDGNGVTAFVPAHTANSGALIATTNGSGSGFIMSCDNPTTFLSAVHKSTGAQVINQAAAFPAGPAIFTFRYATADTPDAIARVNGTQIWGQDKLTNPSTGNARTGLYLGSTEGTSNFYGGKISEVVVYQGSLPLADMQAVESYLKQVWRI
jgi:hypothetical protein